MVLAVLVAGAASPLTTIVFLIRFDAGVCTCVVSATLFRFVSSSLRVDNPRNRCHDSLNGRNVSKFRRLICSTLTYSRCRILSGSRSEVDYPVAS
jgi:hypothetical protein